MADQPPSYEQVQAQSTGASTRTTGSNTLQVPGSNGIPPAARRSMEDEARDLPEGWIRQFDTKEQHQFFVDTRAKPPRSIWHHPYDDEQYLSTLTPEERERLQETHRTPSAAELEMDITDEEDGDHRDGKGAPSPSGAPNSAASELPPRPATDSKKSGLGRKLKDKVTGKTHEQRVEERRLRAIEEQRQYEAHQAFRRAMAKAMETGEPQLVGKDRDGKNIYIEPPNPADPGYGSYGGGYSYNPGREGPFAGGAAYSDPNARFIRPQYPYQRPYGGYGYGGYPYRGGYGYGYGGYGLPLAGGLLGGALLGSLLF